MECGGKRSATPLSTHLPLSKSLWLQSGVALRLPPHSILHSGEMGVFPFSAFQEWCANSSAYHRQDHGRDYELNARLYLRRVIIIIQER